MSSDATIPAAQTEPRGRELVRLSSVQVFVTTPDGESKALLSDIDVRVQAGRCLALVGESGSGKTTLGRTIAGLLPPSMSADGSITVDGDVGYMSQDAMSTLNPIRRVEWQVAEALRARGMPRRLRPPAIFDYLTRCGLPEVEKYARRYPHQLSGGLAQRVLLATVLATQPALIIADEPTSALDVTTQARIVTLFRQLIAEENIGMVLITHDLTVAAHIADDIAVMQGGRIAEQGPVRRMFENPEHPYTRTLLAALPRRSRTYTERDR